MAVPPHVTVRDPHRPGPEQSPTMALRLVAEGVGTFALVFVAAGADVSARVTGGAVDEIARAVAPGLLVMALIYAIGDRSGAHFNPAVTIGFTMRGLFPARRVPGYVCAQLAGAIAASVVLAVLFGSALDAGVTRPKAVDPLVAVALEAILTGILLTVIIGTADRYRVVGANAAIAVGATIALCGLIALPLEGASMNPARSSGPALVTGDLGDLWIYWVGPVVGAVVAVAMARFLHGPDPANREQVEAAGGEQ